MKLIFIHGWAMNHTIWYPTIKAIKTYKPEVTCETIDLGFIKSGAEINDVKNHSQTNAIEGLGNNGPTIIIAHSLGVMWALRYLGNIPQLKGLVSIAGFSNFTAFTSPDTLVKMQQGISQNPASQLALFWRRAGCRDIAKDSDLSTDLNKQNLLEGLDHLVSWDESQAAAKLNCPKLFLASKADKIVPEAATISEWPGQTILWHNTAPHTIQLAEPEWTAQNIMNFINKNNS